MAVVPEPPLPKMIDELVVLPGVEEQIGPVVQLGQLDAVQFFGKPSEDKRRRRTWPPTLSDSPVFTDNGGF